MRVFVKNLRGEALMPTTPRKAKLLLKEGKAKVFQGTPFTIQLCYATGETKQEISLGVDAGYKHIGLSAVSKKEELFTSQIQLRGDMIDLNSERRQYRRSRRHRKTHYRQPRFLNRKKPDGWMAPSIQHKLDSHKKAIERVCNILPITKIVVEVASFDIQKIKNSSISGLDYQMGDQLGFQNVRQYVIERDGRKCRGRKGCKATSWEVHHIQSRKTGGDRPSNLILLCGDCHALHHAGKLKLNTYSSNGFKAETFMSMVRWKLVDQLCEIYTISVQATFGYITKFFRKQLNIAKSHINDAFVIAGGVKQKRTVPYLQKQVRRQNRKLFKGIRSHLKNTAPRFVKGFQRYDKVLYQGIKCFVFGRRSTGYFVLRKIDGTKIHASAKVKDIRLLESASTMLIEKRCVA